MTDDDIRALVRDAVARHLVGSAGVHRTAAGPLPAPPWRAHPSFARLLVPSGTDQDGPCLIEPSVQCTHCGYCQSYGH